MAAICTEDISCTYCVNIQCSGKVPAKQTIRSHSTTSSVRSLRYWTESASCVCQFQSYSEFQQFSTEHLDLSWILKIMNVLVLSCFRIHDSSIQFCTEERHDLPVHERVTTFRLILSFIVITVYSKDFWWTFSGYISLVCGRLFCFFSMLNVEWFIVYTYAVGHTLAVVKGSQSDTRNRHTLADCSAVLPVWQKLLMW